MSVQIEIKSRLGVFTIVDEKVAEAMKDYSWHTVKGYVVAHVKGSRRKNRKRIYLHNFVIFVMTGKWPGKGMEVDHIHNDILDNRYESLRVVPHYVNQRNMKKLQVTSSGYRNVYWNQDSKKWFAQVHATKIEGKTYNILSCVTSDKVIAAKCGDVIKQLIGGWHESKLSFPDLTFWDKWYHIGKVQQEQILKRMAKNNVPIDPLSPYRSWYKAA